MAMEKFREYPLTYSIIVINVILFVITSAMSGGITDMDMKVLVEMGALTGQYTIQYGEWWRLFTAMFLHGGMTHILMNMFSLYLIGRGVEIYFSKSAYVSIYLFSGLLGGLASLYMHPYGVGIGASGAIFGVFGALAGFFLAHRKKIPAHSQRFMKDFGIVLGINLVMGLSLPSIDVSAHIGGLAVGFVGGFVIARNPKSVWIFSAAMVVLILLLIGTLPHYDSSVLT